MPPSAQAWRARLIGLQWDLNSSNPHGTLWGVRCKSRHSEESGVRLGGARPVPSIIRALAPLRFFLSHSRAASDQKEMAARTRPACRGQFHANLRPTRRHVLLAAAGAAQFRVASQTPWPPASRHVNKRGASLRPKAGLALGCSNRGRVIELQIIFGRFELGANMSGDLESWRHQVAYEVAASAYKLFKRPLELACQRRLFASLWQGGAAGSFARAA